MLKAAKELATREKADLMFDLIGVACAPHGGEDHLAKLQANWRRIRNEAVPEFKIALAEVDSAGAPKIPWKQATRLMVRQMDVMLKVNGGGR